MTRYGHMMEIQVGLRLPKELLTKIDKKAKEEHTNRQQYIRKTLWEATEK